MSNLFDEIDDLLRRTNKIYMSYVLLGLTLTSTAASFTKFSKTAKIFTVASSTLFISGISTWVHVFYSFTPKEIGYLKVGLEKSYPSLKESRSKPKR